MEDKELKKMKRSELIDIIYALQQNEQNLIDENEALKKQLEERKLVMTEAGSIADAALRLSHIFEQAQSAADQYLESVKASFPIAEGAEVSAEAEASEEAEMPEEAEASEEAEEQKEIEE